ncbi:hypothetical protein [Nitrospira sp. Kam-Ns4a]
MSASNVTGGPQRITTPVGGAAFARAGSMLVLRLAAGMLLAACAALFHHEQVTYEQGGIRIGIESDLSTRRATPHAPNAHPARLTAVQVRHLLGLLEVSGYSGTLMGLFVAPPKRPVFTEEELGAMAEPIAAALRTAGPEERVFFSVANPTARYERDRIQGALFLRGPYLHFILTDHYAFLRADTAGGDDYKDPMDMKGMKLWIMPPGQAATVPPDQTPVWNPFETVHVSVNVSEALAARPSPPTAPADQPAPPTVKSAQEQDLRQQLRELTNLNRELQERLKEQGRAVEALQQEINRLRKELADR